MHVVDSMVVGGLQRGVVNIIDQLDPDRFTHIVCSVRHQGPMADRLPADRVRTFALKRREHRFWGEIRTLVDCIAEYKPDIVHSRNWGAIEAVPAGRYRKNCAVIHSEHGVETHQEPWRRVVLRRLAYELADCVFAVSHHLRDMLVHRTGFPASKLRVIHNGVDTSRFYPDPEARERSRRRLNIRREELCIGAVGRLDQVKDLPTLLRAAAQLSSRIPYLRILIVGSGPELPRLKDQVDSEPRLCGRVDFLGDCEDVSDILRATDIYALPSTFEGISNSLLEAMACGLPVVVSDTGGNPEVVTDGESGLLFPVGNQKVLAERIGLIASQLELRTKLGLGALARVSGEFSMRSMATRYTQLYLNAVARDIKTMGTESNHARQA